MNEDARTNLVSSSTAGLPGWDHLKNTARWDSLIYLLSLPLIH